MRLETLRPPGLYPYIVQAARHDRSKAGNDMLVIYVTILDELWEPLHNYKDYFSEYSRDKFDQFRESNGSYQKGEIKNIDPEGLIGHEGYLELILAPAKGGYPERNEIKRYLTQNEVRQNGRQDST